MANLIFKDLSPRKEEATNPTKTILIETIKNPPFLNGHLIEAGTRYSVEEATNEV